MTCIIAIATATTLLVHVAVRLSEPSIDPIANDHEMIVADPETAAGIVEARTERETAVTPPRGR